MIITSIDMTKTRNLGLDLIRITACLLVILYHIPQNVETQWVFHDIVSRGLNSILFYFGRCAVPMFFIMSGFLLLPTESPMAVFYRKRLLRIALPTAFWFAIYYFFGKSYDNPNYCFWIAKTPHLWYMYALIGVYLIIPIVSPWYKKSSTKEKSFFLALWGVSLLLTFVNNYNPIRIEFTHVGQLYYTPFHSLLYVSGYIGYFFLGAMIRDNQEWIGKHRLLICIVCSVLYVAINIIGKITGASSANLDAYLSLPTCLLSIMMFVVLLEFGKYLNNKNLKWGVIRLADSTFSIYLMHVLVLENLRFESLGGYSRIFLGIAVFLLCFLLYSLITSIIPKSKYVLG